ncbi:TonB-dependent receptor [Novosphingobium beihaiensis]|uniref:TonB-dependent receptor n=1 Tax=Novosphingobium beihaiensis TaxID=2930389 RepID=A0ABT0BLE4_9SPHN|nr:TonB-dependent receptor [Novosphingobium beihaiensis]MCJ2185867.1 TonB-dependent receptor [Novosphingobium beihaiensis]
MRKSLYLASTLLSAGLFAAAPAFAQEASDKASSDNEINEIIVTATKRAESIQDVPLTVNVVTSKALSDLNVQNTIELTRVVGGLSLTQTSPGEQSISLRGIKMPASGGFLSTATVETYLNDVPINVIDAFASTLDLGQIEVLKGPQGSTRGRPAPSGAITYTTKKGSFDTFDGYAAGTLSNHDGQRLEGAFGGPITEGVAFRVAGLYDHNGLTEVKDINNGKSNYRETYALRGTLSFDLGGRFTADIMAQYTHENGDFYRQVSGPAPCSVADGGTMPWSSVACGQTFTLKDKIALNSGTNPNRYRGTLITANAKYQISDDVALVYVGGYNDTKYFTDLSFDFTGIGAAQVPISIDTLTNRRTITNELRLQSTGGGPYDFIFGGFYGNTKLDGVLNFVPFTPPAGVPNASSTNEYGLFTSQNLAITDHDKVRAGLRFSSTKITNDLTNVSRSYDAITWDVSYQHEFSRDVMTYVTYGKSFRPGSGGAGTFNGAAQQAGIPLSFANFNSEKSRSLEIGLKSQWFDRMLTLNLALFDQKYNGYIGSQFNVACTGVPNPNGPAFATVDGTQTGTGCFGTMLSNGDAISRGVEVEVGLNPLRGLNLNSIFTYTDAHYDNALVPCNDYNNDGVIDAIGTPFVQPGQYVSTCRTSASLGSLPKVSFTNRVSYDFNVSNYPAYIRFNTFTRSSSYFPQTGTTFSGYTTVDGSIGVFTPSKNLELSLWGKNLFNVVRQDTDGGPWTVGGVDTGMRIGTVTNDRELGVTLRATF